jgi:Esterase-like activity of phytase
MKLHLPVSFLMMACISFSCSNTKQTTGDKNIGHLKFLSEYDVPFNKSFKNTTIGGLSGIDYDPAGKVDYMISDDRSEKNPARFYEAKIIINKNKIESVAFTDLKFLKIFPAIIILIQTPIRIILLTLRHCVTIRKTVHSFGAVKVNA